MYTRNYDIETKITRDFGRGFSDVFVIFRAEIALVETFGLKFDYSKCTLHLLAGE